MLNTQQNGSTQLAPRGVPDSPADTRSRRIVNALLQLPQFKPFAPPRDNLYAVHVMSGAHVYPIESVQDLGLLLIRFSGSMPGAEVCGDQYLRLQICEAAVHLCNCPEQGVGATGEAARALQEKLGAQYGL